MIVSVRESKARMSELLNKACAGEDVVISVRGQPKVRIVPIAGATDTTDMSTWSKDLRARLAGQGTAAPADSSREIMDDLRGERH